MRSTSVVVLSLFALFGCEAKRKPAKLQGFDVLTPPGREVMLFAKLERRGVLGVNPDIRGQTLIFRSEGAALGRAETGKDGLAALPWTPPAGPPRVIALTVALPDDSKYGAEPAPLDVYVRDPRRPSLVVDLDHTICDASGLSVAMRDPTKLAAMPGSVDALSALQRSFDLIYLTARDDALITRSRRWLEAKKFPRAPLLVRDVGIGRLSAGKYKRRRLLAMRETWNLVAGVGDRKEDAEAYLAAGMRALVIGNNGSLPEGAERFDSWAKIREALEK